MVSLGKDPNPSQTYQHKDPNPPVVSLGKDPNPAQTHHPRLISTTQAQAIESTTRKPREKREYREKKGKEKKREKKIV